MNSSHARTVGKTIFRIFILRVSGKGDEKGSANQLEVLKQYSHLPDVKTFLGDFKVEMMKASSETGRRHRLRWQEQHGLKVLTRAGRNDFLGISVVIGSSRFICYASTAAGMDEENGNAFTRHVCESIADPAFHGLADPDFMARRDAGEYDDGEHPSLVHAFDPTRFVRTMSSANDVYDVAARERAAFEAKDLHIDPADGPHARMMWMFLAYGSEVESVIGRQRRFVGRLNKARLGFFPYRDGMVPLGGRRVPAEDAPDCHRLDVDDKHITSVARLFQTGLDLSLTNNQILTELAACGVTSGDPKTLDVPVDQLGDSAAKRFFVGRKLEAYRDGELEVEFVGVTDNHFRVGSGHVLTRRWEGLDADGQPDRLGSIAFRLPFPKPTVTGPDGEPRRGWITGLSDEEERDGWNRLLAVRGVDDAGKRPRQPATGAAPLAEQSSQRTRGGPRAGSVAATLFSTWRLDGDERGPRLFTRSHATTASAGPNIEVHQETGPPGRNGGINRKTTVPLANFRGQDVTAAVADLISAGVRSLLDQGLTLDHHRTVLSPGLAAEAHASDPAAEHAERARQLTERLAETQRLAKGYDRTVSALRGEGLEEDDPQLESAIETASEQWSSYRVQRQALRTFLDAPVPTSVASSLPNLDASDPRDLVVGLRGCYATGAAPATFLDALRITLPHGARFEPGTDELQWDLVADVLLATTSGETVTIEGIRVPVDNLRGRGGKTTTSRPAEMAARRMREGQPIDDIPAAGSSRQDVSRAITHHLRETGRFPDDALLAAAVDCPIPETTRILWDYATGVKSSRRTPFTDHVQAVFTGALKPSGRRTGQGTVWSFDLNVDRRLDQLTIVASAADRAAGVRADALAAVLDPLDRRHRRVLDASAALIKGQSSYPPALRRVPTTGHPTGWKGRTVGSLDPDRKRIGLQLCPFDDCAERFATVLVPAVEVLALGAMVICRHCTRAATPPDHPMFTAARRIRFPHSYVAWSDAQVRRTGRTEPCAALDCRKDVGFGPGATWMWDDHRGPVWHDDLCRAGRTSGTHTRCAYALCTIDQGGGPGSIRQEGRGRRTWHGSGCTNAESRRITSRKVEYAVCRSPQCTIDEGGGPGSIRKTGRHRTVHDEQCRRVTRTTEAGLIRRWARERGLLVADNGRLPQSVSAAYRAATAPTVES
ncbi:Lsr2 protein [Klenkia soli]|uniref:Lsr2 protein n=1 Tax=Klenkia soli TaxID=1052260 RepID=A0A1H0G749_9ACTN|nr:Lsr2 family protein [Klenkia soli]SDO02579.1 Lsr2 protein [Klenkia soli]